MKDENRRFLRRVFIFMLPVLIQNGITNFVNMLDNLMVGQVGDAETAAVSIASMLVFIFNLCIFGAVSGAGIFGAQFYGAGDTEGLRHTFRFKIAICAAITVAATAVLIFFGDFFISRFLTGEGDPEVIARTAELAGEYLMTMLIGLLPFALVQCFASTLRETGRTVLPMAAGFAAMGVNLVLNWILIFGNLGAPKMGVAGAAVATVVSRFVELGVVVVGSYIKRERAKFVTGLFRRFNIAPSLMKNILVKGFPMIVNETMWAAGYTTLNRYYSTRGLDVVAANNINITFFNVFSCTFFALGVAVGIIMGQMLGAGNIEEAKRRSNTLLIISAIMS
ncbi:MAG: MATE family efflux transporter, partial [Clostridia bacterium]|nr:MATE family efflux transporter [Clostridia bacterium]